MVVNVKLRAHSEVDCTVNKDHNPPKLHLATLPANKIVAEKDNHTHIMSIVKISSFLLCA